jgi:hypothetical protein
MMNTVILSAFLSFACVFPVLSQETGVPDSSEPASLTTLGRVLSQETDLAASSEPVPFTTIEQGQASRFSTENPGVQPVFSDPETWKSFWEAYTEGREPRPALPPVDFNAEMVLVSSLGEVSGVYVDRSNGILYVSVAKNNGSESSPQATPPFHIVKTEKVEFQSVVFERPNPAKEAPITGEETREGADINAPAISDVETQDVGIAGNPPPCVELTQTNSWNWWRGWKSHATAFNGCGVKHRFRMIWAWALDGACHTVKKSWYEERYGLTPYVSELRIC